MKKYLALPAVALAAAAITSTASAHQVVRAMPLGGSRPVNMINQAGMSWSQIRGFEPGVLQDANSYLRSWWGGRSVRLVNGASAYQGLRVILTRKVGSFTTCLSRPIYLPRLPWPSMASWPCASAARDPGWSGPSRPNCLRRTARFA
jgi:hypothetical protein